MSGYCWELQRCSSFLWYVELEVDLSAAGTAVSEQNGSAKHVRLACPGGNLEESNSNRA